MEKDLSFSEDELLFIVSLIKDQKTSCLDALSVCNNCGGLVNRRVIDICNGNIKKCDVILDKINKILDGGFCNE